MLIFKSKISTMFNMFFNNTPFHLAAISGNMNIVQLFLNSVDIDIEKKNINNQTAFDALSCENKVTVLRMYQAFKAKISKNVYVTRK